MPGTSRLYSQCQKANRICLVLFLHFATIPLKKSALPPTAAEDAVGGSCFVIAGETLQPREDRREGRREPPLGRCMERYAVRISGQGPAPLKQPPEKFAVLIQLADAPAPLAAVPLQQSPQMRADFCGACFTGPTRRELPP